MGKCQKFLNVFCNTFIFLSIIFTNLSGIVPVQAAREEMEAAFIPAQPESRLSSQLAEGELFVDDFSTDLAQWEIFNGSWMIENGELSGTGAGEGVGGAIYAGDTGWQNYSLSATVLGGEAEFILRSTSNGQDEYHITVWPEGTSYPNTYQIYKYQDGEMTGLLDEERVDLPSPLNGAYRVKVEVNGEHILLSINDTRVNDVIDPDPLPAGRIGLGVIGAAQNRFDNVIVEELSSTPPVVNSITRADEDPTTASNVDFAVTFSTDVTGVDASDFSLNCTYISDAEITDVSGSGASYTVSVSTGIGYGTMWLNIIDDDSIIDGSSTPLGGVGTGNGDYNSGEVYTIPPLPSVMSITRANSNPTTANIVDFAVNFSTEVTGVDTMDFALSTSGITGAEITNLSGWGASYTVSASTGSGDGTIRLDLVDDDSISDSYSQPLGGEGTENGDYSTGEEYQIYSYTISGNVGAGGVILIYPNGSVTADDSGNYTLCVPEGWTGFVRPSPQNYYFTPTEIEYSEVTTNLTGQDYIAEPFFTISGKAVSGTKLSYFDGTEKSVTASSGKPDAGLYVIEVPPNWSGTITPSKVGYVFTPESKTYTNISTNLTEQNYTATTPPVVISGNVVLEGVRVNYREYNSKSVISDENGNYSFSVYFNWSGSVTPQKTGYNFDPGSSVVKSLQTNKTINFTLLPGPDPITDLAASTGTALGTVDLSWTAVGESEGTGTPTSYEVRYSPSPIMDETDWEYARRLNIGDLIPQPPGQSESVTVSNLSPVQTFYFSVRANDEINSMGGLSNSPSAVAMIPPGYHAMTYSAISASESHTCVLTTSGGVRCWGRNGSGGLGDGTNTDSNVPVDVVGLSGVINDISAGDYHTCVLTSVGGVKCWGINVHGNLGDGTNVNSNVPVDVVGLANGVKSIAAGGDINCALTNEGGVKCWGFNWSGGLGDGTNMDSNIPVDVVGLSSGVSAISAGSAYACAITNEGGVKCWGANQYGQLGDGTNTDSNVPVDVVGLSSGVSAISTGPLHACALTDEGGIKCWGDIYSYQIGPELPGSNVPVAMSGLTEGVKAISAGWYHNCALTLGGEVKCWGDNLTGQLGDGSTTNSHEPVVVNNLESGVFAISAGADHSCALAGSGSAWCWGSGPQGLGDGTLMYSNFPVLVSGGYFGPRATSITRADADPTSASSVDFTVTFSSEVTGVDDSDFVLTSEGLAYEYISEINGSGASYTVSVGMGVGVGTLRLDLVDDDSIVDIDSIPLGGVGTGNGDFNNGETYTVNVPPRVESIGPRYEECNPTNASSVDFMVSFTAGVTGVDTSDFIVTSSGLTGAAVTGVSFTYWYYTVNVSTGSGEGTLSLELIDNDSITDWSSHPLGGVGTGNGDFNSGEAYQIIRSFDSQYGPGTTRISVASDGTQGYGRCSYYYQSVISADGRYISFSSPASTLVSGDSNGTPDVFVHDRQTGETTRVSIASDGTQANGEAYSPSISADGRYIAFYSGATNLVSGDTNEEDDVFVHDRQTGETTLISVASDGTQGDRQSSIPAISGDGRYVVFTSESNNLVNEDNDYNIDVFLHDRVTGITSLVSVASDGTPANGNESFGMISTDGRYIAFTSDASNLVSEDTNETNDVFVHDRQTGETTRVSVASDGTQGDNESLYASITSDGRYVTFHSWATNLVSGDTNESIDIFVHDRQTGETTRVSVASDGTQGNGFSSGYASISADGRYVAFASEASNLVSGDTNAAADVFLHDRQTGETSRISVSGGGTQANGDSGKPAISADGRYVAFSSCTFNLVSGDTNGTTDIFVRELQGTPPGVASITRAGSSPTTASIVDFTVIFSTDVSGVDTSDFTLDTPDLTGAAVTAVSGFGASYIVSASTGTGEGSLRLDLVDDDSIVDASLQPLGGLGTGNGSYTSGESYEIQDPTPLVYTTIAAGEAHTCGLISNGAVECWGANNFGQLGNGMVSDSNTPVGVTGLTSGISGISAGSNHTCALTDIGGVKCWGLNDYGQLGDGTLINSNTPVDVAGLASGVVEISAGGSHTCALTGAGSVLCWGADEVGQLGDGEITGMVPTAKLAKLTNRILIANKLSQTSTAPVNVFGLSEGVSAISAGLKHTCALTSTGGVKCWGWNINGQLGDGTTTDSTVPVDVTGQAGGVSAISAGNEHSCVLTGDGNVLCWGLNEFGQLGNGTVVNSPTPVEVTGLPAEIQSIDAGWDMSCALTSSGEIQCWGRNDAGQLGDGTTTNQPAPVPVSGFTGGVNAVSSGSDHSCALTSSGEVRCWGNNDDGQLGDGTNTDSTTPVVMIGSVSFPVVNSIARSDPNPTNADLVKFTVSFSEVVTGVDTGDFTLDSSGLTGAAITEASGSGAVYSVTVHTGSGVGTLRLDLVDDDSILDADSQPLGGEGTGNGTFNSGESYTILYPLLTIKGFYPPVDMGGVCNVAKGGSTIPLKFEIFLDAAELKELSYVTGLNYVQADCATNAVLDEIETFSTGSTALRFDTTGDQFIFNWKTPSLPGRCYRVDLTTLGGANITAYFKLK